ncbi:MAG: FMN-binding protein [Planctomycetes bacterium]|nr:FMN-binding protein [Planctomycetota bacterium]
MSSRIACCLAALFIGAATAEAQSKSTANGKPTPGSRAELDALVDRLGKTPPDWFKSTPLNYPQTLDLDWPKQPQGPWNNQKNVGQYLWDVINPNPGRWKEGVKLLHHLLTRHKDDPDKRERDLLTLARMYHNLLEDYGRSAFWFRAAGVEKDPVEYAQSAVVLAECYWRLGFEAEARRFLEKVPSGIAKAKLLGDMGDTDAAIAMALEDEDSQGYAWLAAGDACRQVGRFDEALKYYQKVLTIQVLAANPPGRLVKNRNRAEANVAAIKSFEFSDPSRVPNGTYKADSQGYEAPVEVAVTVKSGKIEAVKITQHREKQFYSAMTDTPRKIITKQSVKGVDTTSNATITSEAIINATAKALAAAQKP